MLPGGVGNLDFELLEPSGLKIALEQLWGLISCMLPGGVGNLDFELLEPSGLKIATEQLWGLFSCKIGRAHV